jgi:hypothetical protein
MQMQKVSNTPHPPVMAEEPRLVETPTVTAFFHDRAQQDNFGNDITKIELTHGQQYYRMVHLTPADSETQRATLYGGPGKFIRIVAFSETKLNREVVWIDVANFKVQWINGVNQSVTGPNGESEQALKNKLSSIQDNNYDAVILYVLMYIEHRKHHWLFKRR